VYFGQVGNTVVVLLCGGDKSWQTKDIKNADKFGADYKLRESEEHEDEAASFQSPNLNALLNTLHLRFATAGK